MENQFWPKELANVCVYAHHPGLHSRTPEGIIMHFLWHWGKYHADIWPIWERVFMQGRDEDERFGPDLFIILQRAITEGQEEDRVFALFLLGALATPEARDLLISFLDSGHRKERWASAISLGRLKEERVFALLQTFLLEGFVVSEIFANVGEPQVVQEACNFYQQKLKEHGRAAFSQTYWHVLEHLRNIDYEWYIRQRSEIAIVLGTWGNPVVVPKLSEALQAAWRMEQDWPDYEGPDESGPTIWHFFQDHLAFALGQLGAWDTSLLAYLPQIHLLVARVYLILGSLQVSDSGIFYRLSIYNLFRDSPKYLQDRISREKAGIGVDPFIEPALVKQLLSKQFGLSLIEQEEYLVRFSKAWYERAKESQLTPPLGL